MEKQYARETLLITVPELRAKLSGANLCIIDTRPAEDYAQGHIPGATHFDLFGLSLVDTREAPLNAFMFMIHHVLELRGVTKDKEVIFYESKTNRAKRQEVRPAGEGAAGRQPLVGPLLGALGGGATSSAGQRGQRLPLEAGIVCGQPAAASAGQHQLRHHPSRRRRACRVGACRRRTQAAGQFLGERWKYDGDAWTAASPEAAPRSVGHAAADPGARRARIAVEALGAAAGAIVRDSVARAPGSCTGDGRGALLRADCERR